MLSVIRGLKMECYGTIRHAVHELPNKLRTRFLEFLGAAGGRNLAVGNQVYNAGTLPHTMMMTSDKVPAL